MVRKYQTVEKRLPGQYKSAYDPYIIRKKRLGRDCMVEIMLQWLIRLVASMLPVGDW